MTTNAEPYSRPGRRRILLILPVALALLIAAVPSKVRADADIEAQETDETINKTVKDLRDDQRKSEKVDSNLKRLESQHRETEFQKRTGAPFRSERSLRHDLRRNEAQQGWQKSEGRRLDYERQRQQLKLQSESQEWRRNR